MKVSVAFANPLDFVAFYNQGLPRFYLNLSFSEIPTLAEDKAAILEETEAEVKMVTLLEIAAEDFAAFEAVLQSFRGQIVSSEELDAMGI